MKISVMSLQDRVRNKAKELNIDSNILFNSYFFDCFLNRLSKSKFSDNFVFKGGFLLSSVLGIKNRFTLDIDLSFRSLELSKSVLDDIIQ